MLEIKEIHWKQAILSNSASIHDAIANLNKVCLKIVMIVNHDCKLVGIISDGDVRRGLLSGISLNQNVESIMQKEPLLSHLGMNKIRISQLMEHNQIYQVPIVDNELKVVGLYVKGLEESKPELINSFVIMAGGFGRRLMPHTVGTPKPMVQVNGKPMLEHIILRAKQEGFRNFIICLHHLGEIISDYFESGSKFDVNIEYTREPIPLGTAGAIYDLRYKLSNDFIVTNGDVISDIKFSEILKFHEYNKSDATMAVKIHEWQNPYGVVSLSGINIESFDEKPIMKCHINAGIYALNSKAFLCLNANEYCDMPELFMRLKKNNQKLTAYPMHETWLDVGRPIDLKAANLRLKNVK